jgi:hypothetical protein
MITALGRIGTGVTVIVRVVGREGRAIGTGMVGRSIPRDRMNAQAAPIRRRLAR